MKSILGRFWEGLSPPVSVVGAVNVKVEWAVTFKSGTLGSSDTGFATQQLFLKAASLFFTSVSILKFWYQHSVLMGLFPHILNLFFL